MATSSPRGPSCQRCAVTATTARDLGAICCGDTAKPRMPLGGVPRTAEQMAAPKGCVREPVRRLRNGVCALPPAAQKRLRAAFSKLEQAAGRMGSRQQQIRLEVEQAAGRRALENYAAT